MLKLYVFEQIFVDVLKPLLEVPSQKIC